MLVILLSPEYLESVEQGTKVSTVRNGRRDYALGPAILRAGNRSVQIRITGVEHATVDQLTDDDAHADGFPSRDELVRALRHHYRDLAAQGIVTVVRFTKA